jgi:hypothetical protein
LWLVATYSWEKNLRIEIEHNFQIKRGPKEKHLPLKQGKETKKCQSRYSQKREEQRKGGREGERVRHRYRNRENGNHKNTMVKIYCHISKQISNYYKQ